MDNKSSSEKESLELATGAGAAWIIAGFILRARFYKNIGKHNNGV